MELTIAKTHLDNIIKKARVHLYKPIQIAEILYRDRISGDIDLTKLETYRTKSKKWRDIICIRFLGRTSISSARYQDDLFNDNAVPPVAIATLGKENRQKNGIVEVYIYNRFKQRYSQMSKALSYSTMANKETFNLEEFIALFWSESGLKRSLDKIYEIIVYALFSTIVQTLTIEITVSLDPLKTVSLDPLKIDVLKEFETFAKKVICISADKTTFKTKASIHRVGITNAADRGLDIWANFGPVIQIKHLSLDEKLAKEIVSTVTSDRIVIVCKDSEKNTIKSLLNQIGWKSKIQSIITELELIIWYEKALRGNFSNKMGDRLLQLITDEILLEFPSADRSDFMEFYKSRGYHKLSDTLWQ